MNEAYEWIKDHRGVLLVALILIVFSPILTDIVPRSNVPNVAKGLLIGGNIVLAVVAAMADLSRLQAQRRLATARSRWDAEYAAHLLRLSQKGNLLQHVSEELREVLSEVRASFEAPALRANQGASIESRNTCIRAALKALCRVLEADSRPAGEDPLKAIYFKATIFEFVLGETGGPGLLKRKYWYYPDTIQPRTDKWDIADDPNSGCVQAYLRRQEVVLESVKRAAEEGAVWKDSRPGQHLEYEQSSMVCVPVWADPKSGEAAGSAVRGVVTVDTNQLGYFKASENERAFRAQVFGPFLGVIRLVYTLTDEGHEKTQPHAVTGVVDLTNGREEAEHGRTPE